jgi:hypothetical protein
VADLHQFDIVGYVQSATVDGSICPVGTPASNFGGMLQVNGLNIVVPCNSVIQMPANTLTWANFVNPPGPAPHPMPVTSLEVHVVGNMVGAANVPGHVGPQHIAGLIFLSHELANSGDGIITSIDYATGNIHVGSKVGAPDQAIVQINDPTAKYGRAQSPDDRFSVDPENPTIHAATGYPMCVPRTDPAVADDGLCPQQNRPKVVNNHCRDWLDAGLGNNLPKGGNLRAPFPGQVYCGHFVMPAQTGATVAGAGLGTAGDPTGIPAAGATDPDATKQAPFEVGDYITYAGTRLPGSPVISAHTIEAQTSIYTQPGTKPSYLAIGSFGVGSADPNATAVNGAGQETVNRMFLEAETTDPTILVDIYLNDVQPSPNTGPAPLGAPGTVHNRWITPFEMTGGVKSATNTDGGGIITMMTGVQTQRARLRATKAPLGLLTSPTRTLRVVARSLCTPGTIDTPVNGVACTDTMKAANGLSTGQYLAPNFDFIFPENTQKGEPVVPNDFWHLGFLINGEGPGTGTLSPAPW